MELNCQGRASGELLSDPVLEMHVLGAVLIFLYTYWEDVIRPRLAACRGVEVTAVMSDIMGDLRTIRNVILHSKGILRADKHKALKVLGNLFEIDKPLQVGYDAMHKI